MTTIQHRDADAAVAAARAFAAEVIDPGAEAWATAGGVPRAVFAKAAARGLGGLRVSRADGGSGLDARGYCRVAAALGEACLVSAFGLVVHNNLAAALAGGSPAQRERYLGDIVAGRRVGAFLLTEPGAGSDAAAITTRARPRGEGWTLDGEKAWISNAATADVLLVYAQTDAGAGARGIAGFLVDADQPGVTRLPPYALLGGHALGTGGFRFAGVALGSDALLAPAGEAFAAAMRAIDLARACVAALCCGALARALREALAWVRARPAFGRTVADFQGVQWMLADCATDLEAARALTARAAAAIDQATGATLAAAQAKKFATQAAFARISACMQVMGAAGLRRDYPLARLLEGARIAQYLDGATEIQNVVIARQLDAAYGSRPASGNN